MSDISRRDFIKKGAKGAAVVSLPFIFNINPLTVFAGPTGDKLSDYYDHFGVTESVIREVMSAALGHGGDYCDIYFQHSIYTGVGLDDNEVNRAYTNVNFGVGIRVIEGDQTGFSFTEEITPKAMKLAAKTAANIAHDKLNAPPQEFKLKDTPNHYPIKTGWEDVKIDTLIPYLRKLNDKVQALDPNIVKSRVWFDDDISYILMINSDGKVACDYQPMSYIYAGCTIEKDGRKESNKFDVSGRYGLEFYTEDKLDEIARKAVDSTNILFDAVKAPAGEIPVVLAAGSSGILLHEAIGHGMEADFNRKEESIFSDKINKKVAENFVSIVDDGIQPNLRGSINVDDECNDSQKTFLVDQGILRSYLHDRISAKHYKVEPTGSGRRQSFRYPVIPRMRNTYMLPGPHSREEIIRSVKKGVICETFTNGEVRIGPGDFTFYVKKGSLIEDGKVTAPIKDLNIIGNGFDVLGKVTMVADDLEFAVGGWTCGKGGQSVPVSMGLPTVLVSSITVGGMS